MVTGKNRITDFQTSIFDFFMRIFLYSIQIYNYLITVCVYNEKLIVNYYCRNVFIIERQKKKNKTTECFQGYLVIWFVVKVR